MGNVLAGEPPITASGAIGLGLFAVASLLVYFVAGANRLPAGRLFDVGSAYQVVVAAFVAARANAVPWPDVPLGVTVPLLALWIVLFPVIVPNTVRRTLAAGVASWATTTLNPPPLRGHGPVGGRGIQCCRGQRACRRAADHR